MSPRIIQLPLSGRDRRHYVRELRLAEQAHRELPARVEEAYRSIMELWCLERAKTDPKNRGKWLAQAERWHEPTQPRQQG
jgi:hypothetical protein